MNANIRTIGGAVGATVMSSIVTSMLLSDGLPAASGYTRGFAFLALMTLVAIVAAVFIPTATSEAAHADHEPHLMNAELAIVPGGTITEGSAGSSRTRPRWLTSDDLGAGSVL